MRWFKKSGTSPRLLSHATLAAEAPSAAEAGRHRPTCPQAQSSRRSRIDVGKSWQRQSSEDSETEATHFYSVQARLVVVEKPRRWRSEPRSPTHIGSSDELAEKSARREAFHLASREKRNPLLDHVKDTRLSCFPSCELLTQFPTETQPQPISPTPPHTEKFQKNPKLRKRNTNDSFSGNSCFSAKLKSISDRYLKCSTSGFFTKLYKYPENENKRSARGRKQRSFSYGSLPALDGFQDENAVFMGEGEGRTVCDAAEDCDSGIIVNDNSSLGDAVCHFRSASGDQPSSPSKSSLYTDSRSSWSSDMSQQSFKSARRKKVSRRSASLDRRQVIRKYQSGGGDVPPDSPRPHPPTPARLFKVVRLHRSSPQEEIGIFIAKTKFCGDGVPGYLIAHIVPEGLAERDGTLHIGDEIVNVNGRRLRGLSMGAAREVLQSGPVEVDIVVARPTTDTLSKKKPSRMKESSVDYENIVLKPRPPPTLPAKPVVAYTENTTSPVTTRLETYKAGNSMNPKLLRKALISYSEPDGDEANLAISRVATSCENLLEKKGAFCTLPRLLKSSPCTFHSVILEKGPGKKSLGFTIVGGKDSPRGPLGIFVKSILEGGQAADEGGLCVGDEILAVNGHVCHDLTHTEAVAIFKTFKVGPLALHVCRRAKSSRSPLITTKSCADLLSTKGETDHA